MRTTTYTWRWALLLAITISALGFAALAIAPSTASALSPNPDLTDEQNSINAENACAQAYSQGMDLGCTPRIPLARPSFKGWTYLNLNPPCPAGAFCAMVYHTSIPSLRLAYRADGKPYWTRGPALVTQQQVYVHPIEYGAPYRWAYTERTGYVLVWGGRFERRYG